MGKSINDLNSLLKKSKAIDRKARRRAFVYTVVPIIFGLIVIWFTGNKVINAQKEIRMAQKEADSLDVMLEEKREELAKLLTKIVEAGKAQDIETIKKTLNEATAEFDWFTVLASYKDSELTETQNHSEKFFNELAKQGELYSIDIYKTRISKNYAVTVGGRMDKAKALELASIARERGWAHDAFAQVDKAWVKVRKWGIVIAGDSKLEAAKNTVRKADSLGFRFANIFYRENSFRTVLIYFGEKKAEKELNKVLTIIADNLDPFSTPVVPRSRAAS